MINGNESKHRDTRQFGFNRSRIRQVLLYMYKFPFIKKCIGLHLAVFKVRDNELRGHFLDPEETFVLHVNKSCGLNI